MAATEFAPQYSSKEKLRLVICWGATGGLFSLVCKLWLFPSIWVFAKSAPCVSVVGFRGTSVFYFGILVGLPLLTAVVLIATLGRRGYKIIRESRIPPSGEKVFRPTRVRRGMVARLLGYAHFFPIALSLALAAWEVGQARFIAEQAQRTAGVCMSPPSIERTPSSKLRLTASAIAVVH